jgi:hypothetical protein
MADQIIYLLKGLVTQAILTSNFIIRRYCDYLHRFGQRKNAMQRILYFWKSPWFTIESPLAKIYQIIAINFYRNTGPKNWLMG